MSDHTDDKDTGLNGSARMGEPLDPRPIIRGGRRKSTNPPSDSNDSIDEILHYFGDVWLVHAYSLDYKGDKDGDELLKLVEEGENDVREKLEDLLETREREAELKQLVQRSSDLNYAIGVCEGLGYPDQPFLTKQYELVRDRINTLKRKKS